MRLITLLFVSLTCMLTVLVAGELHEQPHQDGQQIFRFDTFGDEQLWTNVLRMHEAVAAVDPATALGQMTPSCGRRTSITS